MEQELLPEDPWAHSPISPKDYDRTGIDHGTAVISGLALSPRGFDIITGKPTTPATPATPATPVTPGAPDAPAAPGSSPSSPNARRRQRRRSTKFVFPEENLSRSGRAARAARGGRHQSLSLSADQKVLVRLGYKEHEFKRPGLLGPLQRDKTHYMVYRCLHGDDHAPQHERYAHRCDRRHVSEEDYGKKHVRPPHMTETHRAHVVMNHIGEATVPARVRQFAYPDAGSVEFRGHRRQFSGGHSGGQSSLRLY